jgi:hypothetical protein
VIGELHYRNSLKVAMNRSNWSWWSQCPAFSNSITLAVLKYWMRPSVSGFEAQLSAPYSSSVGQAIASHTDFNSS